MYLIMFSANHTVRIFSESQKFVATYTDENRKGQVTTLERYTVRIYLEIQCMDHMNLMLVHCLSSTLCSYR